MEESLSEPTERTALLDRRDSDDMRKSSEGSAVSLGQALAIPGGGGVCPVAVLRKAGQLHVPLLAAIVHHQFESQSASHWPNIGAQEKEGEIDDAHRVIRTQSRAAEIPKLTTAESGKLSTVFDVGGVVGAMLAGAVADASGCPGLVCAVFYVLSAPSIKLVIFHATVCVRLKSLTAPRLPHAQLFAYQLWGAGTYALNVSLLILNGVLINAPYALITTAVSAELGTHSCLAGNSRALATVTAIIDGTGSVGAALGPMLAGVVSARVGWPQVFYMLIACNMLALLLLIRIVRTELTKLALDRRLAAQRVVRIE
ncbi:Putative glycerol-3-phosphate transporter 1 [Eumeta japonica]|uniref:Glycerol-3-phosphate transporter 1 n=1 Tax=Eumeta variegata TaxID=151549 RepID=A0A4C1X0Q9_EUMVA|nr:Putative glycerol-3-phosphate transporter 1 [Eumeta japonica]